MGKKDVVGVGGLEPPFIPAMTEKVPDALPLSYTPKVDAIMQGDRLSRNRAGGFRGVATRCLHHAPNGFMSRVSNPWLPHARVTADVDRPSFGQNSPTGTT